MDYKLTRISDDFMMLPKYSPKMQKKINAGPLFDRIRWLALSGEESCIDRILYEILLLLSSHVNADIGQINLLPAAGRAGKLFILKDGKPWHVYFGKLHKYDPYSGFTGMVMASGRSILVKDIWETIVDGKTNPFLDIANKMNKQYLAEIKRPVASTIILPLKRDNEIFCTIELSRYRNQTPFNINDKKILDDFAASYGTLTMEYVIDLRNRIALKTAHKKLRHMARLIASNRPIDYKDLMEPYTKLSSADIVMSIFKTGHVDDSRFRIVVCKEDDIREILFNDFTPSAKSILRDDEDSIFPVEGKDGDERLTRFYHRIERIPDICEDDRNFLLDGLTRVKSYVAYSLHMLSQELGAIILGSFQPEFWPFLHMNSFLALYNSLLRSFLLNERVIHQLSDISNKIHNPGFYILGALKGALFSNNQSMPSENNSLHEAMISLEKLLVEIHEQGRILKWRAKKIYFSKWLAAFIHRKMAQYPNLKIKFTINNNEIIEKRIKASDEQLETIFDNLFSNSIKAITNRQIQINDTSLTGRIEISLKLSGGFIEVMFKDNGIKYNTVSGRGVKQIKSEMKYLGGKMYINQNPYCTTLTFPVVNE